MKTKLNFLWMLLLMLVGGVNSTSAFRYVITWHDGIAHQYRNDGATGDFFNWEAGSQHNLNTKWIDSDNKPTYTDEVYMPTGFVFSSALKMESKTDIQFTTTGNFTVTILKCTGLGASSGEQSITIFNNSTNETVGTYDGTLSDDGLYREVRVTGLSAGSYSIKRGSGETGLLYIRVTDDANMTMTVNYNDMMYGGTNKNDPRIVVSNEFAYVAPEVYRIQSSLTSTYLRFKINLSTALSNTNEISVASDNTAVMTYNSHWFANEAHTQVYIQMAVVGSSSTPVNVTVTHSATNATCTGTFTVNPSAMTPYNNSYPYKWDFQNDEWTSTRLQLYNSTISGGVWTSTNANAVINQPINTGVTSNVNMIKSLAFDTANEGLTLDWTNKKLSLVAGSKIRIPGDLSGRIVTFDASGEFAWNSEGTVTKMGANKFYVSSGTGVIFSNASAVDIYSIDISETGVATYETTSAGVFQFTGAGTLAGGTVIRDVPGITMTFGAEGESWGVADESHVGELTAYSNVNVAGGSSTTGTFYKFEPIVDGKLTVKASFWEGHTFKLLEGSTEKESYSSSNSWAPIKVFDYILRAGETYYLYNNTQQDNGNYKLQLNSFSYEPLFINVAKTGAQGSDVFIATGSTTVYPSILTTANEHVTFAASGGSPAGAITVEANGNGTPTLVTPTTSDYTITATIASPNSSVNSKTAMYQLSYSATPITLTFTDGTECNTDYGNNKNYTNELTVTAGGNDVKNEMTLTYTSDNESIATVDSNGELTILNSGLVKITVTATDNDGVYQSATASYWLTVNPTTEGTLTLSKGTTAASVKFGDTYINQGIVDPEGPTITYSSSNETVATVNSSGTVTSVKPGTATITVTSSQFKQFREKTLTYTITIQKDNLAMEFLPNIIYLNPDEYVTPHLSLKNVISSTISDKIIVTKEIASGSTNDCVTLESPNAYSMYTKEDGGKTILDKLDVKITAAANSTGSDQTTIVTVSISGSDYYNDVSASCKVVVRSSEQQNFSWKSGDAIPEYTMYQGDFMLIPPIKGNCSHNNSYSIGSNKHYVKKIKADQTVNSYSDKDYRAGEGTPDYIIVNENSGSAPAAGTTESNDYAYVVFAQSERSRNTDFPDSLMVYAKITDNNEHIVYLRAQDPNKTGYHCDAKITIKPKSTLDAYFNSDVSSMSFPFTWDFTQFNSNDLDLLANDKVYYENRSSLNNSYTGYYLATGYMNSQNALAPGSNKTASIAKSSALYFQNMVVKSGNTIKTLKPFKGLKIAINGTYYSSKIDRVRINTAAPYLYFNGGPAEILLPSVASAPANFKVFVKIKGTPGKPMYFKQGSSAEVPGNLSSDSEPEILSFDATNSGGAITLRFQDASVYWIAASTEAKPIYQPTSTTYPASTYSYTKALDLDKSAEVNTGLTTHYASGFNSSTNSVTMTSLTGRVEANSGLMLKLPETNVTNDNSPSSSCYMIADPENSESYSVPTTLNSVTNYLIATGNTSTTPGRFTSEGTDAHAYTNFILTNTYHKILDNTENDVVTSTSDAITDDWKYVRTAGDIEVGAYKAYLRLPGRLLNINASARAMSESSADSRTVLNIVFDDEQNATGVQSLHTASKVGSDNDGWHTLQGVKVSTPTRGGLYIYKGKKIAVK